MHTSLEEEGEEELRGADLRVREDDTAPGISPVRCGALGSGVALRRGGAKVREMFTGRQVYK